MPDSYAVVDTDRSYDVQKYPSLCDVVTRMALDNGCINREESVEDFYAKCDEVLGAEGVTHEALTLLDMWIFVLTDEERDILADGEDSELQSLVAKCPVGGPDGLPLANILDDIWEVM
jgi:hypothetical protein